VERGRRVGAVRWKGDGTFLFSSFLFTYAFISCPLVWLL
jgi:hypothetical protein